MYDMTTKPWPFFHIVAKNLGASRITYKVVPLRPLLPLATFIFVPFDGCQRQVCDKRITRRRSDFGVLSEQDYLIDCLRPLLVAYRGRLTNL